MWVVAADISDKLPDLPTVRLSAGYLCLEDCLITYLLTCYAVWRGATTKGIIARHHDSYLSWHGPKIAEDQLESTLFVSTIVLVHLVSKLIPPHVCHFQVLKRDKLKISLYLEKKSGQHLVLCCSFKYNLFFFLRCKDRPHRVNKKCGHVFFHVSPLWPCRGVRVEWPPGLEGHPVDQNGPRLHCLPLCYPCISVDNRPWAQSPTLRFTTQWDLSGLWMRRGWWRWSGRMEAAVCTPSPGSETTVSAHCVPWTRLRHGSCCCPTLISTPGLMLSSSQAMVM